MEAEPPDDPQVHPPKPRRRPTNLVSLVAGLFGEDASGLATFDFATLSFVGWVTLVSTFSVWMAVIVILVQSHLFANLPELLTRCLYGVISLIVAVAWFKIMRIIIDCCGLTLCKGTDDRDDRQGRPGDRGI